VWALTSAGETDLDDEIDNLKQQAENDNDPYILGLLAASLYNLDRTEEAREYADRIAQLQNSFGKVAGARTSITSSRGSYLDTETTSIAVIAWLHEQDRYSSFIEEGISYIQTQIDAGSYGTTQSTVLALKAITTYMKNFVALNGQGAFVIRVNGQEAGRQPFDENTKEAIEFDLAKFVADHQNDIFVSGEEVQVSLSVEDLENQT